MTICVKCARKYLQQCMTRIRGDPRACVACKRELKGADREAKRWRRDRLERYFCDECAETILHRQTDACYYCRAPLNPRGMRLTRAAQNNPAEGPAYRKRMTGRKVA